MKLLLDTHALLWFLAGDVKLGSRAKLAIEESSNDVVVSVASLWEIAIKVGIGKLNVATEPGQSLDDFFRVELGTSFRILPIEAAHALRTVSLPHHHRDPFDRLLIAQALVEGAPIASCDENFVKYGVPVVW